MSSRQRERLRREEELRQQLLKSKKASDENDDDAEEGEASEDDIAEDDDEEEEDVVVVKKKTFVFSESESSSGSDSEKDEAKSDQEVPEDEVTVEETSPEITAKSTSGRKNKRQRKKILQEQEAAAEVAEEEAARLLQEAQEKRDAEETAFLDAIIAAKQSDPEQVSQGAGDPATSSSSAGAEMSLLSLQDLDLRMLDLDAWIRVRFGGMQEGGAVEAGNRGGIGGRRGHRQGQQRRGGVGMLHPQQQANLVSKRLYFCQQKDDWSKPPSFIAGGIGMKKTIPSSSSGKASYTLYSFEWSKEYQHLHSIYEVVQHLGDPNYLVMFLANNPYHVEGFLELGMLFLRTGQMERGLDCIRRCIFVYECFSFESFPFNQSQVRMNPLQIENKPYFQALYRYMQLSSRQGFHILAIDIGRILLTLNPMDDFLGLLLLYDSYLLQGGKYEVILQCCGLTMEDLLQETSLEKVQDLHHWKYAYLIDVESKEDEAGNSDERILTVENLPNWWFSVAFATFLLTQRLEQQRRFAAEEIGLLKELEPVRVPSSKIARLLLQQAILRYPFMVEALLTAVEAPASIVNQVRHCEYFTQAEQAIPPGSYFHRIVEGYAIKQEKIWTQKDGAVDWLVQTIQESIQQIQQTKQVYTLQEELLVLSTSVLQEKYANIALEEFQEEYTRLPMDLQAIDDDLLDPRVLGGGVRFPKLHQQLLQMKKVVKRNQRISQFFSLEQQHQIKQRQGFMAISILLDLTRPLLQIFLLTLLPWIAVPRYQRPRRR